MSIRSGMRARSRHLAVHYGPVPDVNFRLRLLVLVIRSYGSLRLRFETLLERFQVTPIVDVIRGSAEHDG